MSNIYVCDAIMGSGKSSAAITYMNEHADQRFIYITPYLTEATRIFDSCPDLHFVEPQRNVPGTGFTKTGHIRMLIERCCNIATTHKAFEFFDEEMLEMINEREYTLIVDESLSGIELFQFSIKELDVLIRAGYISTDGVRYELIDDSYEGDLFREVFRFMKTRSLIKYSDDGGKVALAYWTLPPNLISSFKDVFILTYLFEGQDIHHMLEMHRLPYQYIGVVIDEFETYRFDHERKHLPAFIEHLNERIHILETAKLNAIGGDYYDLSENWFKRYPERVEQLKNHVYNFFNHVHADKPLAQRMWSTHSKRISSIAGKGYKTKYVVFNERAKNIYRDRTVLAYAINVFMNVSIKNIYAKYGVETDDDDYALSIMLQWIWRSAIRDGGEIYIYIPSARMRNLLSGWIARTQAEYRAHTEGGERA